MTGFVPNRWMGVFSWAAPTFAVWLVFVLYGYPWTGLLWVSLAFSAAIWAGKGSNRSIAQVIDDIEAEPAHAMATRPVPKAILGTKGDRP